MRTELIKQTIDKISKLMNEAGLTIEEGINCAGQLLPAVLLVTLVSEQACHDVLNRATESSHLYINGNWREAQEIRDRHMQQRAAE